MKSEKLDIPGPRLEPLLRRIAECPSELQADSVNLEALSYDLLDEQFHLELPEATRKSLPQNPASRLIPLALWLLKDDWFCGKDVLGKSAERLLSTGLKERAKSLSPSKVIADPDRREEFVRLCLWELSLHPEGESQTQADDRLMALDSGERRKLILAARQAEERAREIRKKMAEKAALEAAAKYGRE